MEHLIRGTPGWRVVGARGLGEDQSGTVPARQQSLWMGWNVLLHQGGDQVEMLGVTSLMLQFLPLWVYICTQPQKKEIGPLLFREPTRKS